MLVRAADLPRGTHEIPSDDRSPRPNQVRDTLGWLTGGVMNNAFTNPGSTAARFIQAVTTLVGNGRS